MKMLFLMLAIAVVLCGCSDTAPVVDSTTDDTHYTFIAALPHGHGIFRITDSEMGVVCWLYSRGSDAGAISCLALVPAERR